MKYKTSKTTCKCGQPRRMGQRDCAECHSARQRIYREAMRDEAALSGTVYADAMRVFKRGLLLEAIAKESGNLCRAAIRLGVHRNTMNRVMREVGLSSEQVRRYRGEVKG